MDGNGRWACQQGKLRFEGHRAGIKAVKTVIQCCIKRGIPVLSLFAFSSENWQRPREEVSFLMELFLEALQKEVNELSLHGVRLIFSGDRTLLNPELALQMERAEQLTADNQTLVLNVMVNYGGKWDITQACRKLVEQVSAGKLKPEDITEEQVEYHLSNHPFGDPDLLIRTSGEQRISNFFLWQLAYTELYFTDILWPEFDEEAFEKALLDYSNRQRRYGVLPETTI